MTSPEVIVIGAGPSGIALAHALKQKLGFHDFTVSRDTQCINAMATNHWIDKGL